jgi:predicted CXXCH cytochrome family protein
MPKTTRLWLWIAISAMAVASGAKSEQDAGADQKQRDDKRQETRKDEPAKEKDYPVDPSQYVGAETCKSCHEQIGAGFDKSPHGKHQEPGWQGCEACHGPGKAHAESADPDKIIRFEDLSREASSKRCLGCHKLGQEHENFLRPEHIKNNVGCLDCHSVHSARIQEHLLRAALPQLCSRCHLKTPSRPS